MFRAAMAYQKHAFQLIVLLGVVALTGCASSVTTDYDSSASFASYKTWAFAEKDASNDFMSLDSGRVEAAVKRELEQESMQEAPQDSADLLVSYRVEDAEKLESSGFTYGLGLGRGNFGFGVSTAPEVRQVKEGKLVVDLVDRQTERVIWSGISRRYLNERQSPEARSELIDEVVAAMFEKYPPL
ncbi:DUF4136 domain-containing protein [Marinobacter sp. BGYM27]|uniref:DUF4136 domain-containing protein n=1 Tax=unclassified Marinobacter TaxID=83889 RepID=UPI0021A5E733|nr:DUF4136 domain-containing protein [Marinobacter sp. BGYM27]MDG5499449.1 DUF4136 domain-containing protein [Marinobacter sp. BGYM27]